MPNPFDGNPRNPTEADLFELAAASNAARLKAAREAHAAAASAKVGRSLSEDD